MDGPRQIVEQQQIWILCSSVLRNFLRAGTPVNKFLTSMIVPWGIPQAFLTLIISRSHIDFKTLWNLLMSLKVTDMLQLIKCVVTPRKPKLVIWFRSFALLICSLHDVPESSASSSFIPMPLSEIFIKDLPPLISIAIFVACASMLFSTNSLSGHGSFYNFTSCYLIHDTITENFDLGIVLLIILVCIVIFVYQCNRHISIFLFLL